MPTAKPPKRKRPPARKTARKQAKKGRPSELAKARPKILAALKRGMYLNQAAAYGGVVYSTFRRWLIKGQAEVDALNAWLNAEPEEREGDEPKLTEFGQFVEEVEVADAQGENNLVTKASKKNPVAILERRWPDRWGKKSTVALQGGDADAPPIAVEGAAPVNVSLVFEYPDDDDLWKEGDDDVEDEDS